MKNTFGNNLTVTLFGESHGKAIGAVIDGMPSGVRIDESYIALQMDRRRASSALSTARREADQVQILSGVKDGISTGTPIALMIENTSVRRSDYDDLSDKPRPSHADYSGYVRYRGNGDASGGGHFSGRLTAPLTAAGAICQLMLKEKGISVMTHIASLHGICDRPFDEENLSGDLQILEQAEFPVLDESAGEKMKQAIREAAADSDSVGGILATAVSGLEAGIGEPWFDSIESMIAHAIFSIPAVKGIEFGEGFGFEKLKGSEANDPFILKDKKIQTLTNHNGGVNGGISNGMPVLFQTAVKPTPSIAKKQKTVDLSEMRETEIEIKGRHDPAIIHRAVPVIDAMTALVLCDLLIARFGCDYFGREKE